MDAPSTRLSRPSGHTLGAFSVAAALAATFIVLVRPYVSTLPYDFDEAWMILDARSIHRGLRPFIDFPYHEPPLYLYLLALAGKLFGPTLLGFRMLSVVSLAASGVILFALVRPFVGFAPALTAEALFLFAPPQVRALDSVPETPMVLFTLLGMLLLFVGNGRASAYAAGAVFVLAILVKPTALVVVAAVATSLAFGRAWRRLGQLTAAGMAFATVGFVWLVVASDGIFLEILRFHVVRLGTRSVGMWSIDSGFAELRQLAGIETPWQLALSSLWTFYDYPYRFWPIALLATSALGIPVWIAGCGRRLPSLRAFALLWPAALLFLDFVAVDFTSPRYFVPFLAASAFLLAALVWVVAHRLPATVGGGLALAGAVALGTPLTATLGAAGEPWYYQRAREVTRQHASLMSFTPMLFASTGAEPACDFANPALTYGAFGETFLMTERTRGFRFSDEQLIACLRANPDTRVVVDWAFYFFTRRGSSLRAYLRGDGLAQRLFFSPDARDQWTRTDLAMSPFR